MPPMVPSLAPQERRASASSLDTTVSKYRVHSHYRGSIERFFQSEVRPVYFGGRNDAFLLLKTTTAALILVNLFGILVYMNHDRPPSPHIHLPNEHHHGLLRLIVVFETAATAYYSDGQIVIGWLLSCWFLGYNVISAVIWWQFERRETMPPDDHEIIPTRVRRRPAPAVGNNEAGSSQGHLEGNILFSHSLHSAVSQTPSSVNPIAADDPPPVPPTQMHQHTNILLQSVPLLRDHDGKERLSDQMNPFDKSIVVVTMPDGDFAVAKRQKPAA